MSDQTDNRFYRERPPHVQAEIDGMRAVPDSARGDVIEPWATRLEKPTPVHVAKAVGALATVTSSRRQALMVAYTLDDARLLAQPAPAEVVAAAKLIRDDIYLAMDVIYGEVGGKGDTADEAAATWKAIADGIRQILDWVAPGEAQP